MAIGGLAPRGGRLPLAKYDRLVDRLGRLVQAGRQLSIPIVEHAHVGEAPAGPAAVRKDGEIERQDDERGRPRSDRARVAAKVDGSTAAPGGGGCAAAAVARHTKAVINARRLTGTLPA